MTRFTFLFHKLLCCCCFSCPQPTTFHEKSKLFEEKKLQIYFFVMPDTTDKPTNNHTKRVILDFWWWMASSSKYVSMCVPLPWTNRPKQEGENDMFFSFCRRVSSFSSWSSFLLFWMAVQGGLERSTARLTQGVTTSWWWTGALLNNREMDRRKSNVTSHST